MLLCKNFYNYFILKSSGVETINDGSEKVKIQTVMFGGNEAEASLRTRGILIVPSIAILKNNYQIIFSFNIILHTIPFRIT